MKKIIKSICLGIMFIIILPFGLMAKLFYKLFKTQSVFTIFAECFSAIPSIPGHLVRACYYKQTLRKTHFDLYTAYGCYISKIETKIGRNVYIGGRTTIGLAEISDNCVIANTVSILSGRKQHNFENADTTIAETENVFARIVIGENVFIGDQSVIMANIGDKTIIGAGSVVVKDIPGYSVAVGNPCRVVKDRKEKG